MKKHIKRVAVFIILTTIAIIFVMSAIPLAVFSLLGYGSVASFVLYILASRWALLIVKMSGARLFIAGREHIPPRGPVCFVCNHCGIFDIVLCLSYIGRPFGFIAKKELGFIPFLNLWILLLGGLFIERNNPRKALKTMAAGVERIKKGSAMLIFPEGTRSKGRGLLPFKSGALKLAVESGAVIIPVAISGSDAVFEQTGFICAADVHLSFGSPIYQEHLGREHRRQVVTEAARQAVERMLFEQGGGASALPAQPLPSTAVEKGA